MERVYMYDASPEMIAKDDAIERLAALFFERMEAIDPGYSMDDPPLTWETLPDDSKPFWIDCMGYVFDVGGDDLRLAMSTPPEEQAARNRNSPKTNSA